MKKAIKIEAAEILNSVKLAKMAIRKDQGIIEDKNGWYLVIEENWISVEIPYVNQFGNDDYYRLVLA